MTNYDVEHLRYLAAKLTERKMSIKFAATQVRDRNGDPRPVHRSTLCDAFKRFGIEYPDFPVGRPQLDAVPEELLAKITELYDFYEIGCTKMFITLKADYEQELGFKVTEPMVEFCYHILGLWRYQMETVAKKPYRCRYEACYVHLFWHTDLHEPKDHSGGYYIAFLDDCSRRVMYVCHIENKKAETTAEALRIAIWITGYRPFAVWSDNGSEFKGEFEVTLEDYGAKHVRTKPYNPEQNGKMERWWPNLEKWLKKPSPKCDVMEWAIRYNKMRHKSLPPDPTDPKSKYPMSPEQAYQKLPWWYPASTRPRWRVNGEECDFHPHTAVRDSLRNGPRPPHPPPGTMRFPPRKPTGK
jgi:hypothetical protein